LAALWHGAGLPAQALAWAALPGRGQVLPASFDVATAAQAGIGAAALAAAWLWHLRTGQAQQVRVDRAHATLECQGAFTLDGHALDLWDKLSGLYPCGTAVGQPGWVRVHANFAHHRDIALQVLGLPTGPDVERDAVTQALQTWAAPAFEQAVADAGGVVAAARSLADWDAHPQALALAGQPPVQITPLDEGRAPPRDWPPVAPQPSPGTQPLSGLRVLDLTRILAGPVAGRTLAAHGADVLLVNGPHLPNIGAIADTSRGKRSARRSTCAAPAAARSCRRWRPPPMCFCRATGPARWPHGGSARRRWRASIRASWWHRCRPMARPGPGPAGAASTHWCRRPPA
jgi:hypothetical protein